METEQWKPNEKSGRMEIERAKGMEQSRSPAAATNNGPEVRFQYVGVCVCVICFYVNRIADKKNYT